MSDINSHYPPREYVTGCLTCGFCEAQYGYEFTTFECKSCKTNLNVVFYSSYERAIQHIANDMKTLRPKKS